MSEPRYAPAITLPPYSYVPGHDLPRPANNPAGHLYAARDPAHEQHRPLNPARVCKQTHPASPKVCPTSHCLHGGRGTFVIKAVWPQAPDCSLSP
jgi:hypothetical protein